MEKIDMPLSRPAHKPVTQLDLQSLREQLLAADVSSNVDLSIFERVLNSFVLEAIGPSIINVARGAASDRMRVGGTSVRRVDMGHPFSIALAIEHDGSPNGYLAVVDVRPPLDTSASHLAELDRRANLVTLPEGERERRARRLIAEMNIEEELIEEYKRSGFPSDMTGAEEAADVEEVFFYSYGRRPAYEAPAEGWEMDRFLRHAAALRGRLDPSLADIVKAHVHGPQVGSAITSGRPSYESNGAWSFTDASVGSAKEFADIVSLLRPVMAATMEDAKIAERSLEIGNRSYISYRADPVQSLVSQVAMATAASEGGMPGPAARAFLDQLEFTAHASGLTERLGALTSIIDFARENASGRDPFEIEELDKTVSVSCRRDWALVTLHCQNGQYQVMASTREGTITSISIARFGRDPNGHLVSYGDPGAPSRLRTSEFHRDYANNLDGCAPRSEREVAGKLLVGLTGFPHFLGTWTIEGGELKLSEPFLNDARAVTDLNNIDVLIASAATLLEERTRLAPAA
jgi:hypothetical protein